MYLPLILISSQMNTEKWNMNIHFHVHQPRSSSKHVLAIQILSVRPSVCHTLVFIKTAERIVMIFSPHDSPFILVFTADARSVGNSQLSCYKLWKTKLIWRVIMIMSVINVQVVRVYSVSCCISFGWCCVVSWWCICQLFLLGRLRRVDLIISIWGSDVRLYVRPPVRKKFFRFRWNLVCR